MIELRVYYEDTDAGGVVYYANYLRYFERARLEYFRQHGLNIKDLADSGLLFVVVRTEVNYHSPAQLDDLLQIETKVNQISKISLWFDYVITRKLDNKLIVTGKTKLACINHSRKLTKIPEEIIARLSD